jgi:hypothetical protein
MIASTDIVVRRCTVRVVRHGGWSWGPRRQQLVEQVIAALPGLIAGHIGGLPDHGVPDVEITEPVRISVSLRLTDLLAGRFDPIQQPVITGIAEPGSFVASPPEPYPVSRSRSSSGTGAGSSWDSQPEAATAARGPRETPSLDYKSLSASAFSQPTTLVEFLTGLFDRDQLDEFLVLLPVDTLETWYQALSSLQNGAPAGRSGPTESPVTPPDGAPRFRGDADAAVPSRQRRSGAAASKDRIRQLLDLIAANVPDSLPRRGSHLISDVPDLLAAAAASAAGTPTDQLRNAIVTVAAWAGRIGAAGLPRPDDTEAHGPARPVAELLSRRERTSAEPVGPQTTNPYTAVRTGSDVDIASALPFLLLGPLARAGYLSALVPALQAVGLERETPTFATALAYTVLGPLGRGWHRQPKDLTAAAAFAGVTAPVPGQALTEFARAASPALPALDALVTRALAEGHTAGEPLIMTGAEEQTGGGLLLLDQEGLFPIAWADTVAGLLPAWRMCGSPPILVAPTALAALRSLAAADATFVVASPPGRDERWRRLLPHWLWTNGDDPALARHAVGCQQATDLAADLVQALAAERAAAPLAADPALARSLLLAAGLGLGTLAWTLWREREPTDPLLALERFADLSARVSFEPHRVQVRLPLGPRHADLSAHGLLADVPSVPWLGGRVVEFSGG